MENNISEIEQKVLEFAKKCHGDQKRKYTGNPYWYHLKEVAEIVKTVEHTDLMVYAAYLHDTLEDTPTTEEDIRKFFFDLNFSSEDVDKLLTLIKGLTDKSRPEDGNRKARKEIDKNNLGKEDGQVQTVKLADTISNTKDIIANDKRFSKTYIPEKIDLLKVLVKGNPDLYKKACEIVNNAENELKEFELSEKLTN